MLRPARASLPRLSRVLSTAAKSSLPPSLPPSSLPPPSPAASALLHLLEGNRRFSEGKSLHASSDSLVHQLLQNPLKPPAVQAVAISCSSSSFPLTHVFDTLPGEMQTVRVCGPSSESHDVVLGSVEFALAADYPAPLLIVVGDSDSSVIKDAVRQAMLEDGLLEPAEEMLATSESSLVRKMLPVARDALRQEPHATFSRICDLAAHLNVWNNIEVLLTNSRLVHDMTVGGKLQLFGCFYDACTKRVEVLGEHPSQGELLVDRPAADVIRTATSPVVPYEEALAACVAGNKRFSSGNSGKLDVADEHLMSQLAESGQNPVSIVLGCADSRAPIEMFFDMKPGDLFVLRNAGNTCADSKGSVIGSAEYSVSHLGTRNIIVLGHTKCGAVTAAVQTVLPLAGSPVNIESLDMSKLNLSALPGSIGNVLRNIVEVAAQAIKEAPHAPLSEQVDRATVLNVHYTIEKILRYSDIVREEVAAGSVQLFGGVYNITSGEVHWLGPHPKLEQLVGCPMPLHRWKRTPYTPPAIPPPPRNPDSAEAMKWLQEGNRRFVNHQSHESLRPPSDSPFAVIVSGSEVYVPLETIFDARPGDLVVNRTMGNIAGCLGGSIFSSVEYSLLKWKPKLLIVMGESDSAIIDKAFDQLAGELPLLAPRQAIMDRVMVSVLRATEEMKSKSFTLAGKEMMKRKLAVQLNVLYSMERLLKSPVIEKAITDGSIELHGAVLNCSTAQVEWLGEHPMQAEILKK